MTRACTAALFLASASVALSGQGAPPAPPPALAIDFVARDASGAPVLDLRAAEVSVRVGNTTRPVRALQVVRTRGTGADAMPPPFASSLAAPAPPRTLVIVLDDDSMRPGRERPMRAAVSQLLEQLAPADRVAVVTVPLGGIRLDLTTNHALAAATFNGLGGKAARTLDARGFACRSKRTLETLASLLGTLGGGRGPTSVLFIASSLSGPTRDAPQTSLGAGMCEIVPQAFEAVAIAAAAARANFFVVQPEDQMITPGSVTTGDIAGTTLAELTAGINHLAGVTGADVLRLGGATARTLSRVLDDSGTYYVATVDAQPSDRGVAQLDVSTTREGVTVHARPRIALKPADTPARPAAAPTPQGLLREARARDDFAVRATAYVSSNPGDARLRVIAVAETEPASPLAGAAIGIFDPGGKLVAQWTARDGELSGTAIIAALLVPPGTYRLRVAAVDARGRAATADHELDATMQSAGKVQVSGLVLGVARDGAFRPRLVFSGDPDVVAQVELTGIAPGPVPEGRVEIADSLNGPAISSAAAAVTASADPTRATVTATLPIRALPPGDYAVRLIVSTPQGSARVVRTLRKVS